MSKQGTNGSSKNHASNGDQTVSKLAPPPSSLKGEMEKLPPPAAAAAAEDGSRCDRKRGLPLFVANTCLVILCYMMLNVYTNGVVRTIERRFALRSSQTGFLSSCNDITHICLVVFIGYFGRRSNKPKIMCVTVMFSAVAGLLLASPHFLLSSYTSIHDRNLPVGQNQQFCESSNSTSESERCASMTAKQTADAGAVHPAFYIFLIAQLINGVGSSGIFTLSLAYIDENAPRRKSALYIGALTSMYSFGPIAGLMLAALCLSLPENLTGGSTEKSTDPTFIGAWWLGYMISGVGLAIFAMPLWFYPKRMTPHKVKMGSLMSESKPVEGRECGEVHVKQGLIEQAKEFPRALLHLFRNKAYIFNLCDIVCGAYIIYGIFVNIVRYIEIHFHERAFVGSIIAGLVSALAGAVGGFSGGAIMARYKLRPTGALKLVLFSSGCFIVGIIIILFISCPQVQMAGENDPVDGSFSVVTQCNYNCSCPTNRKSYNPVCGNDNLTYFSPCAAGCLSMSNGTYKDCGCVNGGLPGQTSAHPGPTSARPGLCIPKCKLLIPYAVVLLVMSLIGALARVPSTMVSFRIVDDDERSFALGINSFAINLLGFIPAPLLFGYLIDSSCILWQKTCQKTGVCLLFDTAQFRHLTYGVALVFEVLSFCFVLLVLMFVRRMPMNKIELNLSQARQKTAVNPVMEVDNKLDMKPVNPEDRETVI